MTNRLYLTDEALIEGIRRDEEGALNQLYSRYYPMTLHLVLQNSGTDDEAKDVFQESVIVLYEKIREDELQLTCQLKTYLYSICRRLWLKRLAQRNRGMVKLDETEDAIALEEDSRHDEREAQFSAMATAMQYLGEPCKSLLESFYLEHLSMQDITERFGYTNPDNAKTQKYKCLQRLKKLFFARYSPVN